MLSALGCLPPGLARACPGVARRRGFFDLEKAAMTDRDGFIFAYGILIGVMLREMFLTDRPDRLFILFPALALCSWRVWVVTKRPHIGEAP